MMNKQSLDTITDFNGADPQPPCHHLELETLLIPNQAENK